LGYSKKPGKTEKISYLITKYKNKEKKLIYNECNRNYIVELWYDCLIGFNKKI